MYLIKLLLKLKRKYKEIKSDVFKSKELTKIKKYKNKFKSKKAIIMCNGPSLNNVDFEMLKSQDVFCFGLNKINLLFDKTDFRPSAIVSINKYVIEQNKDFFNKTNLPIFIDYLNSKELISNRKNIYKIKTIPKRHEFSKVLENGYYQGNTVTYAAMQIAYYLGFSKVALVGCDHYFATKGEPNKLVNSGESDPNHFDPNYFAGGVQWQLPDLEQSEIHYKIAKKTFEEDNRIIYNCTEGGSLEIFERMDLKDFVS